MKCPPILYSFRRCPYAIRARLALKVSGIQIELREIKLADKPDEMLSISPKGTVPVLLLPNGPVVDESFEIMTWALEQADPQQWLNDNTDTQTEVGRLISFNDNEFKYFLDRYKYADRFPEESVEFYRQQAEVFLQELEEKLSKTIFLLTDEITIVDMAIFPFIRQFAFVDKNWFDSSKYNKLQNWLNNLLETSLFSSVMVKHPLWSESKGGITFL